MVSLFGFELTRRKELAQEATRTQKSFVPPWADDGALVVQSGSYYGTYVDLDGTVRNEIEMITKYRDMAMQPEIESAVDDIINEAIITDNRKKSITINLDNVPTTPAIKKKIEEEFNYILKLLNFSNLGHDIFKRWYIDGRLFYHVILNQEAPEEGIKELRIIDPRRIRKIREIQRTKDPRTGMDIIGRMQEYYLYNERGMIGAYSNMGQRIALDSIINVNSGLLDSRKHMVVSYLHKAIKPLNNLRMVEDATVIYRLSRAPERRVFYIDVGNMPTIKADQYMRDVMTKYRNKLVYDANTGEIQNDRKYMAMLEDFWLPRREGNMSTKIDTLPGGQNLGNIEDVEYFEAKLYKSLSIPYSRAPGQQQGGGMFAGIGRSTEITRDELKFGKFIERLRNKFCSMFDDALKVQLVLKKICTEDDWELFGEDILYDFKKDNNYQELKDDEINMNRFQLLTTIDPFVGRYVSVHWVRKNVLRQTDEEIEQIDQENMEDMEASAPTDEMGNPIPTGPDGMPMDQGGGEPGMEGGQESQENTTQTLKTDEIDASKKGKYAGPISFLQNPPKTVKGTKGKAQAIA